MKKKNFILILVFIISTLNSIGSSSLLCPTLLIPNMKDTTICANQVLSISAPAGYASYKWSQGDNTQISKINAPGKYNVVMTDGLGCTYNTSINVNANGPMQSEWKAAKSMYLNISDYLHVTDNNDNAYLLAYMNTSSDTIRVVGEKIYSEKEDNEIVIIKFDKQSKKQWVKKLSMPGTALFLKAMTFDPNGNMYFGGYYTKAFSYKGNDYIANDYFIIKTDSTLAIQWVSTGGVSTTGGDVIHDIKFKNNKLYILGEAAVSGNCYISGNLQTFSAEGTFVACINASDASYNWSNTITGDMSTTNARELNVDSKEEVYVKGRFTNRNLAVNSSSVPSTFYKSSMYSQSCYIARFGKNGDFKWIKNVVAPCNNLKFTLSKNDEIVLLGDAPASFYLDETEVTFPPAKYLGGAFVAKYDSLGVLMNYRTLNSEYKDIILLPTGEFCVMGNLNSSLSEILGTDTLTENYGVEERFFVGILDENLQPVRGKSHISTFGVSSFSGVNCRSLNNGILSVFGFIHSSQDYPYPNIPVNDEEFDTIKVSRDGVNFIVGVLDPSKLIAWKPFVLPADTAFCKGAQITLKAPKSFTNIAWSNGSTNSDLVLSQTASVYLSATDIHGCPLKTNTFTLTVHPLPTPKLGNDTTINSNNFLILFPGLFNKYLWNDGSVNAMNTIGLNTSQGTHSAWVQVTDSNGCVNSDTITISFNIPQSVKNISKKVRIYPNPASNYINIDSDIVFDKIALINMASQTVLTQTISSTSLNSIEISKLAIGTYTLLLYSNNKIIGSTTILKE